jgi:hypothetical protein
MGFGFTNQKMFLKDQGAYIGQFQFFAIVYVGNSGLALSNKVVVHNVVAQQAHF